MINNSLWVAIMKAVTHERFGELMICFFSIIWVVASLISIPAFDSLQDYGFESLGERVVVLDEKKDVVASFMMTFILPLLIDELSTPQYLLSYLFIIAVVYAALFHSNLYYQSPVLALLKYKVFTFRVVNPQDDSIMKANTDYIGITKHKSISEESAIMWKYIADDVFLIYNEYNN